MSCKEVDGLYSKINWDESLGSFSSLPNEILVQIVSALTERDLAACREVSKGVNYLVEKAISKIPFGFEFVAMKVFSKYVGIGQPEQATKFIQRVEDKAREQEVYTFILLDSISGTNLEVMKMAMSVLDFDINGLEFFEGKTLLHLLEEANFKEGIEWLMQQEGIDPTIVDVNGRTAAEHGQFIRKSDEPRIDLFHSFPLMIGHVASGFFYPPGS